MPSPTTATLSGPSQGAFSAPAEFTVTLDQPAGVGGVTVNMFSTGVGDTFQVTEFGMNVTSIVIGQTYSTGVFWLTPGSATIMAASYSLLGPPTVPIGMNSAPFTVTPLGGATLAQMLAANQYPNGVLNGTITVSWTGGATGSQVLTFSNSSIPQTFTIAIPSGSPGTITLTCTNTCGLANPASMTVTPQAVTLLNNAFLTNSSNIYSGGTQANGAYNLNGAIMLETSNTYYMLEQNFTTNGTAFAFRTPTGPAGVSSNSTLDLNGYTVTYDNAYLMCAQGAPFNGGFETGDLTNWTVTGTGTASVVTGLSLWGTYNLMWGTYLCKVVLASSSQTVTLTSGHVTIPTLGISYTASFSAGTFPIGQDGTTVAMSVIDNLGATLVSGENPSNLTLQFFPNSGTTYVYLQLVFATINSSATIIVDYIQIVRNYNMGVYWEGVTGGVITSSQPGGAITQGTGTSWSGYPVFGDNSVGCTVDNVNIFVGGQDTCAVYFNNATNPTVNRCTITSGVNQITDRQSGLGFVYMAAIGVVVAQNNSLSGSHQSGIAVVAYSTAPLNQITSVVLKNNNIAQNSKWTDGYSLGIGQNTSGFEVAYNTCIPISGRGLILDAGTGDTGAWIQNGTVHDNYFNISENPDLEYGQAGLEATALRVRSWENKIANVQFYNNVFYAHTGVGQDWCAIGARIGEYNDIGQNAGSNCSFAGNVFQAIVTGLDPNINGGVQGPPGTFGNGAGSTAWALSFARVEPNTGITFTNNQCISNCVSLNLGDNDSYGWTVQDITLAGNQLAKSSLGIAMNYYATQIAMDAVYVNNVRLIDQAYAGGSSSALYMIEAESSVYAGQAASDPYGTDLYPSVGPNNVSTGYQVTVTVQHSGSNVTGAAVAITGQTPTGTTNSSGKCVLPVSTTSYASPITGYTPTSTSLNPVTITANTTSPAYSGSWTGTLSGDAAITIPIS